jgi:hypothetical protein
MAVLRLIMVLAVVLRRSVRVLDNAVITAVDSVWSAVSRSLWESSVLLLCCLSESIAVVTVFENDSKEVFHCFEMSVC